jgi:sulfopyruvate decarboxylase subunit beta
MRLAVDANPDAVVVSSCGYPSRDLHGLGDRDTRFYVVGSMGLAGSIITGLALSHPGTDLMLIEGDGSFAMGMTALPVMASHHRRLLHLVLDNGLHESTGGQRVAPQGDLCAMALAAGYRTATRTVDPSPESVRVTDGANLVVVPCGPRTGEIAGRVEPAPREMVERTRRHLRRTSGRRTVAPQTSR